jgi:hypothetical protein
VQLPDWYCQLMALFTCSLGDFAVVRWCQVVGDIPSRKIPRRKSKNPAAASSMMRKQIKFELDGSTNKIKYDVLECESLKATGRGFDRRPPYITMKFDSTHIHEKNLFEMNLVDAAFF